MFKLNAEETRSLLRQPESGMGFQAVEATLRDNRVEAGIAYNAELLFLGNETQTPLQLHPYPAVLELAQTSGSEIRSLRVLTPGPAPTRSLSSVVRETHGLANKRGPAAEAPVGTTKAEEVFARFSAFQNDRRVAADNSLLPGSYATTWTDALKVATGAQAVARYALPNPTPAVYRFTITPKAGTDVQRGVVAPAHGQPGGGDEVIFPSGTAANTVTVPPAKLPAK
jgi:hypothetical protein